MRTMGSAFQIASAAGRRRRSDSWNIANLICRHCPSLRMTFSRSLVPKKGLEPPHPCGYMDLNHARLPIPPLRQVSTQRCGRAALKEDTAASILTRHGLSVKPGVAVGLQMRTGQHTNSSTRGSEDV